MTPRTITALMAGFITVASTAPLLAQDPALSGTDAIARRQELMKSNGQTLRGAGGLSGDAAMAAAQTFQQNFMELHELFPEDSQSGHDTEALPAIWENKDAFTAKLDEALAAAKDVETAAKSGDATQYKAALKQLGDVCFSCHQTYRVQKQN